MGMAHTPTKGGMMNASSSFPKNETVFELASDWKSDVLTLIRKELDLAKTELSEKLSCLGRNGAFIAAGGVCALMALFILFLGLGAFIAWALGKAGLSIGLSYFIGYFGLGLLVAGAGYMLIMKGIHAISAAKLAPEKTISSLKEMKGEPAITVETKKVEIKQPKKSSDELKHEVEITQSRLEQEAEEIKDRLTARHMARTAWAMTREHPVRIALISAVTGLSSFALFKWRMRARLVHAFR
jgi:hypothetical protein